MKIFGHIHGQHLNIHHWHFVNFKVNKEKTILFKYYDKDIRFELDCFVYTIIFD